MSKSDGESKQNRKELIFRTILTEQAIKEVDLAERLNIGQRTVNNYLRELENERRITKEGLYWQVIDFGSRQLRRIDITPEEGMALWLAARSLAHVQDERNEVVETAFYKLANAIKDDIVLGNVMVQAAQELADRPERTGYNQVFRALMQAYVYRRTVEIVYKPAKGESFKTTFQPYLFEPSLFGLSIYAIGHSSLVNKLRTYKIERIQSATLTRDEYRIPDDFAGLAMLKTGWSGMYGENTQLVRLRFSPAVRNRVLETHWHGTQKTYDDPSLPNYLIWEAHLSDWLDLLPWAKGWGSAVEVLEPLEMRREIEREVRKMTQLYGLALQPQVTPKHYLFWAKMDRNTQKQHLLIYHMLDVGQMAQTLWDKVLPIGLKQRIAKWLQCPVEEAGRTIAFWASLHDLGKASPAFQNHPSLDQSVRDKVCQQLKQAGFNVPSAKQSQQLTRHEAISAWSLMPAPDGDGEDLLASLAAVPRQWANLIGYMLSGHHGAWYAYDNLHSPNVRRDDVGEVAWREMRTILFKEMQRIFQPHKLPDISTDNSESNVLMALVSGLVSVADWLGSDEDHFNYEDQFIPVDEYTTYAAQKANLALEKVGWDASLPAADFDFAQIFQFSPKAAQIEVISALKKAQLPALAIIEAPMGYGKTEMALAVYAAWAQQMGEARLYVAMPTTATSNQMWDRVAAFLGKQHSTNIQPLLVHGQALLKEIQVATHDQVSAGSEVVEDKGQQHHVTNQTWFLPRKKSLLVPFGVGTVDQSLMSVLQTKHFFVRLLGLANKVVIFDEVHAYDAYMTVLFERLLIWLKAIGASVIVLSATLPQITRNKLLMAWDGKPNHATTVYPRLSWVDGQGGREALTLTPPPSKQLRYGWISREMMAIVGKLKEELRDGGCAVVICNTVTRAQMVYNAILEDDELKQINQSDLILFHARFPMVWREDIEKRVLNKFGPNLTDKQLVNPSRPKKAIVVATQVVEQSLDLDFDVMISDHAPVDLLLQRSGRLHRHQVNEANRKHSFVLWVALPEIIEDVPRFERSDTYVYAEYVLLRSWLALHRRPALTVNVPADVEGLIEQVYGERALGVVEARMEERLKITKSKFEAENLGDEDIADANLVREPSRKNLLSRQRNQELDEDDPTLNLAFRAVTRLGDPGVNVVCLHRLNSKLFVLSLDDQQIEHLPNLIPNRDTTKHLARSAITVRHPCPDVEKALLNPPNDSEEAQILKKWQKITVLKYYSVAIFEGGVFKINSTKYTLTLDKKLGLKIE